MELLTVKDLSFQYPDAIAPAVSDVSFSVARGEFVALCGATGSGKSTLLRLLKRELSPRGERQGEIAFDGVPIDALDDRTAASGIGFVMQHPEQQIVTDKVWHELAFGLENLGVERGIIHRRVAEMASYFGIESWFDRSVSELSGGQKQLLNLASVMVMQPRLLLLDEPTAQLDPIAASNFINTLKKLNRELSLTIVIIEHRLEEIIPRCDRLLVLDGGRLIDADAPRAIAARLPADARLMRAMPTAVRLFRALHPHPDTAACCPLDEREGREFIESTYDNAIRSLPEVSAAASERAPVALEIDQAFFRYERTAPDVLRGLSLTVYQGESVCILGGNGSGKTTTLGLLCGLRHPYSGRVSVLGKPIKQYRGQSLYRGCVALLPQDVQTVFLCNTVREELKGTEQAQASLPYSLEHLYDRHPYDLSGGEQQLVALAKVLATEPEILLLDEPTKGLDAYAKLRMIDVIRALQSKGMTVVTVTHDVEFAAACADRCAMFFRGEITSIAPPRAFFSENSFYTTAASRITRGHFDGAVTVEDAVALCLQNKLREGAL
ncbi:MAG: energy-coupling factor ABC transporter ATP-binding protein [Clostridia bacterium]|nr:energy-coupling factor ABC transporter ATP-binding protein [Clostridia bacterium]